jgi:xanthine dehydrogenase YagS FAD-binding subunit
MMLLSYDRPRSIDEAIRSEPAVASSPSGGPRAYIAGGTELVPLMRAGLADLCHLVDLQQTGLPTSIERGVNHRLRIGAGATMSDVAANPIVRERWPVLAQALLASASPQIRNVATIGGNLLQRTRCSYFRDAAFACNKRVPGSGCSAQEGHNRSHAILGGSPSCVAVHASDLAVALSAVDASLSLVGPDGTRHIRLQDFYLEPRNTPWIETALAPRELIVEVECTANAASSAYVKVRDRASFHFALVSAAAVIHIESGTIVNLAIALGGVAPRPWRLTTAEHELKGRPMTRAAASAAVRAALSAATPLRDNAFKIELAQRAAERAVAVAGRIE